MEREANCEDEEKGIFLLKAPDWSSQGLSGSQREERREQIEPGKEKQTRKDIRAQGCRAVRVQTRA